jgi:hypothetical protein
VKQKSTERNKQIKKEEGTEVGSTDAMKLGTTKRDEKTGR